MNDTKKRAVIYIRVSSREQVDEGNSLATQERLCREYAHKNGFVVAELFEEKGESAKTALRTELQRMFEYCAKKKNNITTVLCYKLNRMARDSDDYSYIRILLKRYGVGITSITEYFENTPAGRFMENVIVSVSQFDNDMRAELTKAGMEEAVRDGRFVFLAPLGYDNVRIGGKSNIAPNLLAPAIRKTFEEVAKYNASLEDIRAKMIKEGLTNRTGKPIAKSQFYRMLRNETYAGWINKYGGRHKGIFEPIITDELFQKVQHVLQRRTRRNFTYQHENPDFPLRRFVTVESGEKMTGCWSRGRNKKYPYYRLKQKGFTVRKEYLEKLFLQYFDKYAFDVGQLKNMRRYVKESLVRETDDKRKQAGILQKQIAELKRRQQSVIDKNYSGVISDQILGRQIEMLDNEVLKAEIQLSNLNYQDEGDLEAMAEQAMGFLKNPSKWWLDKPFESKLKIQWFAFPKGIVFYGNKVRTVETAFLFKAKNAFSEPLSQNGSFLNRNLNQNSKDSHNANAMIAKVTLKQEIIRLAKILDNNNQETLS